MPCKWVTVRGRRVKIGGSVTAATATMQMATLAPSLRLAELGLLYASGSPTVTLEELRDAVVRVWWNEERGWFAEF